MPDVTLNIFDLIESVCQDFRGQWKSGKVPSIEQYLLKVPEQARLSLFRNLLKLDIDFRKRRGEQTYNVEDYLARFPQFKSCIHREFGEYTLASMHSLDTSVREDGNETLTFELPAASRIGDYELVRELGRGGFGVVYEAQHVRHHQRVALKTLPTGQDGQELNADRLHHFRNEFRSLAEINHPNLVGMQTLEVEGAQWFFTMDLIDGIDFLAYVRPQGKLDEQKLRESLKQLVTGVISLHQRKILHRDLKPSNVLVSPDGRVTILDFGLVAKLEQQSDFTASLRTQHFAGTPPYAAPEQVTGERSEASDWYAMGTMLYEALTGERPFQGSPTELLVKKREEDAPKLAGRSDLPQDLTELADRLLNRDPQNRPRSDEVAVAVALKPEGDLVTNASGLPNRAETSITWGGPTTLIGREEQLASLKQSREKWRESGEPVVTWISGLSGEGKSSLADLFLEPLRASEQTVVFSGRCYDRESVPFKVVDSLIDPLVSYLRARESDELESIVPDDIAFLAKLFPVLRRVEFIDNRFRRQKLDVDERQIRYRGFAALRSLLLNIGRSTPLVVFIDDLQWGDGDSAEVVIDLLRTPDAPNVLFLGGFRSDEASESEFLTDWENLIADEANAPEVNQVTVGPLSVDQCVELVALRTGAEREAIRETAETFFDRTKGNPYLMEQLVHAYDPSQGLTNPIPLHEIINQKLESLPTNSTPLLETVAISGKAISFEDLEQLVIDDGSAFTTLTHMRSESLVRLVGSREEQLIDTYHDKIRETVLAQMPDEKRRRMHLEFGEYLESHEQVTAAQLLQTENRSFEPEATIARLFDLAFHFSEAKDRRAFGYQLLAGEQAVRSFAFESALDYLKRAEGLIDSEIDNATRFRVFERLGLTYTRLNQSDNSFKYYQAALDVAVDPLGRATAHLGIGFEHKKLGDIPSSMVAFDNSLSALGLNWPKTTVGYLFNIIVTAVCAFLIPLRWQRAKSKTAAAEAAKASETGQSVALSAFDGNSLLLLMYNVFLTTRMAAKSGDKRQIALGYNLLAGQFAWFGNTWIVNKCLRWAEEMSPGVEDRELLGLKALQDGITLASLGEHRKAIEVFDRGVETNLSIGDHYAAGSSAVVRGHSHGVVSTTEEEFAAAQQLLGIVNGIDDRRAICWAEFLNAHPCARRGNFREAFQFMNHVMRYVDEEPTVLTESIARSINAYVLIQASHHAEARLQAEQGWKICEDNKMHISYLVRNLPLLMEATSGANWLEGSAELDIANAKKLCRRSRSFEKVAFVRSPILRTRGRLLCRLNQKKKAIKCIRKALDNARKQGAFNEIARCLLDLAAASGEQQDERRREAVTLLRQVNAVIPRAESWLLGDQYDEAVVAPEFDLAAWEKENGPVTPYLKDLQE